MPSASHSYFGAADARDRIRRLRSLANLFDSAIPLPGGMRIGLDPIIGLIPIVGDAIGALVAVAILTEATQLGVPRSIVWRMIGNVMIDSAVGVIPLLGDLFDFAFKANSRNVDLLERYHLDPRGTQQSSRSFLVVAAVLCATVLIGIPALLVYGVVQLVGLF
ncbi:MAG TPA: DUF4112 domain-containing protein [Steroidobacteraceae bacterium]|nr:DUF4112 domain-containing protein [Steroidobacteraceae bacterium]